MMKFSVVLAVATYLELDVDELKEYRYQSSRTPCPVYSYDDDYLTATKTEKPPRGSDDYFLGRWKWARVETDHPIVKKNGWVIWRNVGEEEDGEDGSEGFDPEDDADEDE